MNIAICVLVFTTLLAFAYGFTPNSRMGSARMVMLFNFGKKPSSLTPAAPKAAPKVAAAVAAKPAAKVSAVAAKVNTKVTPAAAATAKATKVDTSRPNPTPEAYVDSGSDFFAFARKLPDWMKQPPKN